MKRLFISLLLQVGVLSCITAGVLCYNVLTPAEKSLPQDVKRIAFLYRNIHFQVDSITKYYKYNDQTLVDTADYRNNIAHAAYLGFSSIMKSYYAIDSIPELIAEQEQGAENRRMPLLASQEVAKVCSEQGADFLVTLDDISIFNNYSTWFDGLEYKGVADITAFEKWTFYKPNQEQAFYHYGNLDSLQVQNSASSLDYLLSKKLPHRDEIMETVAFSIGERIAQKLVPQWKEVSRYYYNRGSRELRRAARQIDQGSWEGALAILKNIELTTKTQLRARAAFNVAVVYERIGEIDKALKAIAHSIALYKIDMHHLEELKKAEGYERILVNRKKELQELIGAKQKRS